jgi:hypothetical protein
MLPVLAPAGSGAVQMSGAGHPAGYSVEAAPSSCSPARATLRQGIFQPAASGEYSSPLAKPTGAVTARKRRAAEDGDGADNETVVNRFISHRHHQHPQLQGQSSRLGQQPSGRGEVGGSMVPAGGEVAMPSRFETGSVAAWSQLAASGHMACPASHRGAPQDSGSNQHEEEARGKVARGRATTSKVPVGSRRDK